MNKLTPKQEAFCLAYIETGNASEAYRLAYNADKMKPETINVKASELLQHGKVSVRLFELQNELKERHDVSVDSINARLDEVIQMAIENEQASAAVSGLTLQAKLFGLLIEKREIKQTEPLPPMLPKERKAALITIRGAFDGEY